MRPDVMMLAKALGGGLVPIGAVLCTEAAYSREFALEALLDLRRQCARVPDGLAALEMLTADDGALLRNVRARGEQLSAAHHRLAARYPEVVRDVRGTGLLLGLAFEPAEPNLSDWGRCLTILSEQGKLVPVIASHLLVVEGIRTAPTLNGSHVLRVEPPLTVSADECERYIAAIERTTAILAEWNTGALCAHLAGKSPATAAPPPRSPVVRRPVRPGNGDEGRFAFIVHPIDDRSFLEFDSSLKNFSPEEVTRVGPQVTRAWEPFCIGSTRVQAPGGASAYGDFICVPLMAPDLLALSPAEAVALVGEAVDMARRRGARIVGLGGYTSIITQGGARVTNRGVAVTSGNSFTVVAAVEALDLAAGRLGMALAESEVAIVGAAGAIGGAVSAALFERIGALMLVGRPGRSDKTRRRLERMVQRWLTRLLGADCPGPGALAAAVLAHAHAPSPGAGKDAVQAFAARLVEENGRQVPLRWSSDVGRAVCAADGVFCTTSSAEELILPEHVKAGAVLCDLSRPPNVSRRFVAERPDVLVIDGGLVDVPGLPDMGFNTGFPRGVAYACVSETMMLALGRHYEHTSIGTVLDPAAQELVTTLSRRFGFKVTGLRSFDRQLEGVDWDRLRRVRGATADRPAAYPAGAAIGSAHVPAAPQPFGPVPMQPEIDG